MPLISKGAVRKLSPTEKLTYKGYTHVTLSEFIYEDQTHKVVIPSGFLTNFCGVCWLFHDYLYASHHFTRGRSCSREQADNITEKILAEYPSTWCWVFVKLSKLNPVWMYSKSWNKRGSQGPQMISYELKKDI